MKNYDYKDETKDVKGKVGHHQKSKILPHEESNFICSIYYNEFSLTLPRILIDWETQCYSRAPADASGLEKRRQCDHSQPRRSNADDREKHLQTSSKRQEVQSWFLWDWNWSRRRDGPCLATPPGNLRVLPVTRDKWICWGPFAQGLRDAIICSRIPGIVRLWRICWKRLSKEHSS